MFRVDVANGSSLVVGHNSLRVYIRLLLCKSHVTLNAGNLVYLKRILVTMDQT